MDLRAKLVALKAEAEFSPDLHAIKRTVGNLIEALLVEVAAPATEAHERCYHCSDPSMTVRAGVPLCLRCCGALP